MYRYADELDRSMFWRMPRSIVTDGIWATLPQAAQAVLPVYGAYMNLGTGLSFPDELTLAALCGASPKICRAGRNAIVDVIPGVTSERYTSPRGRRAWRLRFARQAGTGRAAWKAFYRCVLHGGNWAHLRMTDGAGPTAQALYVAMLAFAHATADALLEDETAADPTTPESFGGHPFELCEAERAVLLDAAGITRRSFASALASLQRNHLVELDEELGAWRVYRIPPKRFRPSYLNAKLKERGL